MSVTYSTTIKSARMQIVADALASGSLVIGTSSLSGTLGVLVSITLGATAATVTNGVLTISGVPLTGTASATGTAALAELRNSSGTTIVSGLTVNTSSADIIINSTSILNGGSVTVTSGIITHA